MKTLNITMSERDLKDAFVEKSHQLASLLRSLGVSMTPYRIANLDSFSAIPVFRQHQIIDNLDAQATLQFPTKNGHTLKMVERSLQINGFAKNDDLLDRVSDDHLVEIYGLNHDFIFANARFFETNSYDYLTLNTCKWFDLYKRDMHLSDRLRQIANTSAILFGKTASLQLGPYEAQELFSSKQNRIIMTNLSVTPLKRNNRTCAVAIISDCVIV